MKISDKELLHAAKIWTCGLVNFIKVVPKSEVICKIPTCDSRLPVFVKHERKRQKLYHDAEKYTLQFDDGFFQHLAEFAKAHHAALTLIKPNNKP